MARTFRAISLRARIDTDFFEFIQIPAVVFDLILPSNLPSIFGVPSFGIIRKNPVSSVITPGAGVAEPLGEGCFGALMGGEENAETKASTSMLLCSRGG